MRRRDVITLLGGAAAGWPLQVRAQQQRVARVAYLGMNQGLNGRVQAFQTEMARLGWSVGRNLQFDERYSDGPAEIKAAAIELLDLKPDVIVAGGGVSVTALIEQATAIPIVFIAVTDPVASGFVSNLARPGGNITGFFQSEPSLAGKWVELLKELAPGIRRAVAIYNPASTPGYGAFQLPVFNEAARMLGLEPSEAPIDSPNNIESVLKQVGTEPPAGIIAIPSPFMTRHQAQIATTAIQYGLPLMSSFLQITRSGGLASYGPDLLDGYRSAAVYADRILKGAKPADLPVQAAVKLQLCINLKTAKALSLEIPPATLALADEVIE